MDFIDVLEKRRSVRAYSDRDVSKPEEARLISLARKAPSAGGIRGYDVVSVRDAEIMQGLYGKVRAPLFLVVCAMPGKYASRYGERGTSLYALQDATIYASYIQLIAVDMGLSSVWIGAFSESGARRLLDLDDRKRPVAIIALGHEA